MIINLKKAFSFTEFLIDIDTVKGGVKKNYGSQLKHFPLSLVYEWSFNIDLHTLSFWKTTLLVIVSLEHVLKVTYYKYIQATFQANLFSCVLCVWSSES